MEERIRGIQVGKITVKIAVPWLRMCFAREQVFELDDEASYTLLV
jgi:hypothetical protein